MISVLLLILWCCFDPVSSALDASNLNDPPNSTHTVDWVVDDDGFSDSQNHSIVDKSSSSKVNVVNVENDTNSSGYHYDHNSRLHCLSTLGHKSEFNWKATPLHPTLLNRHESPNGKGHDSSSNFTWTYEDPKCPLHPFNLDSFCHKSLGCGKKILMVGDSTVESLTDFWLRNLPAMKRERLCPEKDMKCSPRTTLEKVRKGASGCMTGPHVSPIRDISICNEECGANSKTSLTYIRHDYLQGTHGKFWYATQHCEAWWSLIQSHDVILLSTGPHAPNMLEYPFTKPAPPNFDFSSFAQNEVNQIVSRLVDVIHPNQTVIYLTAHAGSPEYDQKLMNCSAKPLSKPSKYNQTTHPEFHWDKIPFIQRLYKRAFRQHHHIEQLVVMDIARLNNCRSRCRRDWIHFRDENFLSPLFYTYNVLHNILMELSDIRERKGHLAT